MCMSKKTKPILTHKQASFAFEYITNGRNASEAYRTVYNLKTGIKPETVWRDAHKVLHNPKVITRVGQLQQEQYHGDVMGIEERKLMLTDLARAGDIKSIDLLNKMENVYIEKHIISTDFETSTLQQLQKQIMNED